MPEWSQRTDQQGYYTENHPSAFNQVSASLFHCCVDMHIPNNPACFPLTIIDSKHAFINSNERKRSYVWNLMHNSAQRFCTIDSFQNVVHLQCVGKDTDVQTQSFSYD
jgi:hypothetical protein